MKAITKKDTKTINFNIDDNKVEYTLANGRKIAIDTGDINLPIRVFDALDAITNYLEEMGKKHNVKSVEDIQNMTSGDLYKDLEELRQEDIFVRDKINRAFNTCEPDEAGWQDVAYAAFGTANCVSISKITGHCYYEDFFDTFYPVIEAEFGVRTDNFAKTVDKYTAQKGKHSK